MKGIKFEKLDMGEGMFCRKLLRRLKGVSAVKTIAVGSKFTIAKIVQKPWMCIILKNGKKQGVGFSKQCRYAPGRDEWNEDIGKNIALSRAVRDMIGK